jgi:hypothetical protein
MWSVEALEDMSTTMISIAMELDDKLLTVRACRLGIITGTVLKRGVECCPAAMEKNMKRRRY